MPRKQFYRLLQRLLPGTSGPLLWHTFPTHYYSPIENEKEKEREQEEEKEEAGGVFAYWMGIFVLRVKEMKPGLYAYLMDPLQLRPLQESMKDKGITIIISLSLSLSLFC